MKSWILGVVFGMAFAARLAAQGVPPNLRSLGDVLMMDQTMILLQREAMQNAEEIAADLFGDTRPGAWVPSVGDLFEPKQARRAFDDGLARAVGQARPEDIAAAEAFYAAPLGKRIIELELEARSALLAPDVEAAAKESWRALQASPMPDDAARAARLRDIVAANDLIETNVAAALNGNLAFYQGMAKAGALEGVDSAQMMADVWAQEGEMRRETEDWIFPFLAMAYATLSLDELQTYIDFSETSSGRMLNGALFAAFDDLGKAQSKGMGLVAGRLMAGQDI